MFKPRIFISSTLSENLTIRKKLFDFYASVGAEALLYEKNLTPSINRMTYREDILESDFVIFIIKDNYGSITENGISGTHEEFRIAFEKNIPFHVYIKIPFTESGIDTQEGGQGPKADLSPELKKEIEEKGISYFYFIDDDQLLQRITETTFSVAHNITLKKIDDENLPRNIVRRLSIKHDYKMALDIVKIIESVIAAYKKWDIDLIETTLFTHVIDLIFITYNHFDWYFINPQLDILMKEMSIAYQPFNSHPIDYTSYGDPITVQIDIIGPVRIDRLHSSMNPKYTAEQYLDFFNVFLEKYYEFKNFTSLMILQADILK